MAKIIRTWRRREKGFSAEILFREIPVGTHSKIPKVVDRKVRPRELRALQNAGYSPGLLIDKAMLII